jgi:sulfide dehydrogenase [flavocytochrome c] flavoprotein subunit
MTKISRRRFNTLLGAAGAASGLGLLAAPTPLRAAGGRVVVIGGGFGGATAAKYIRMMDPSVSVTLVEANATFHTCPFSNLVLGGLKSIDDIAHGYDALNSKYGVAVVHKTATALDPTKKTVSFDDGGSLAFDRAIVSPGIDFRWDAMEGYDEAASASIPHAWKAGPQTMLLRQQLEAMPDGGSVLICPPGNPFRCPPGPYERASMIAHYLKTNKPKSKVIILDAKEKFSKQGLFMAGWESQYPGIIEWRAASAGGKVSRVDVAGKTVETEFGAESGDVINFIPSQWAGRIARDAGLANDKGWCPVDQKTFESSLHPGVHVIGDASIAGKMPKSGFSANSQAKVAAAAVTAALKGEDIPAPSYANTCYSFVGPAYGISVAAVYRLGDDGIAPVEGAGGVSPKEADAAFRQKEAEYAQGWYDSITQDIFG